MRIFIEYKMNQVFSDFKEEISDSFLCELKDLRFDRCNKPDYSKVAVQQLYLLRYFPAYLCEYKILYSKVLKTKVIKNFSILSIGCGCCIDYYAAYLAIGKELERIEYWGVDSIQWNYVDSLENQDFHLLNNNIRGIKFFKEADFNIIIFPKSLSEIDESDFGIFLKELSECELTSQYIFLISSTMNDGFAYDSARYDRVAGIIKANGFLCADYRGPKEMKHKGALNQIDSDFNYPNDMKDFITHLYEYCKNYIVNGENCHDDCKEQLKKFPILTAKYISFQINCFERV